MLSEELLTKTLKHHEKFKNESFVVKPSLPILYFGNLSAYLNSTLRIVTVGKNPSDNEFRLTRDDPFSFVRFPKWAASKSNLIEALDAYFETNPLRSWFSSFEPILNGMNSSFYRRKNYNNNALHTDVCSPLATSPTWSILSKSEQRLLYKDGYEIWSELIEQLQPDVMLISIPEKLFTSIINSTGKNLISFKNKKDGTSRKKPYNASAHEFTLKSGKKIQVIFGRAANKPFDTITNEQKGLIGEEIINFLDR